MMMNQQVLLNFLNGRSPCVLYLWERAEQYNLIDAVCQQLSEECAFDTSTKGKNQLVSAVRKRKTKDTNMEAMQPGTLKLKTERDFVAQTSSNVKQLEELETKIFDLQLLLIDGNIAAGSPKYVLLHKRMERLQSHADKLAEVGEGIERDSFVAKMAKDTSELSE